MKTIFCLAFSFLLVTSSFAVTKKALFIGNSYVYTNNLPDIIAQLARSTSDTFVYQSSAPGGYTFQQHCTNSTTLSLLAQPGWDYVILQEQSQYPSFPDGDVAFNVYPYARKLDSMVHQYNPCAKTVFYMTWGRKNGDAGNCAFFPPVCTYRGMDSLLQLRYKKMAEDNRAWLSPVAKVWRRLRDQSPAIELYNADESHPSEAGSFAAAAAFYSLFFSKDPSAAPYNYTTGSANAALIKNAAKAVVSDSLSYWRQYAPLPAAAFSFTTSGSTATFSNTSAGATSYKWSFGDGATATAATTSHTYAANGTYNTCLTAYKGCDSVILCKTITIGPVGVNHLPAAAEIKTYPNPAKDILHIDGVASKLSYVIYNISGIRCDQGTVKAGSNTLRTSHLANGTYTLILQNAAGGTDRRPFEIVR